MQLGLHGAGSDPERVGDLAHRLVLQVVQNADLAHPLRKGLESRKNIEVAPDPFERILGSRGTKPIDHASSHSVTAVHIARAIAGDDRHPGCDVARPCTITVGQQLHEGLLHRVDRGFPVAGDHPDGGDDAWVLGMHEFGHIEIARVGEAIGAAVGEALGEVVVGHGSGDEPRHRRRKRCHDAARVATSLCHILAMTNTGHRTVSRASPQRGVQMDTVLADPDARRLLSTIYRVRPGTVEELRALQGLPRDRIPELLQRLDAAGLIAFDGDAIEALSPDRAMATAAEQVVSSEMEGLRALAISAAALSALTRDWEVGSSPDDTAPWAEFVHGHEAQWKAWPRYAVTHPPRNPVNLYPDLRILRDVMVATMTDDEKRLVASAGLRGVFPRSVLAEPADRAFLDELRGLGARIRIVDEVPSWVYADRGLLCALPLNWAEHPPSSIAIVTHPSITEIVSLYVESIWDKAVDYPLADDGWKPVLHLLARGLSDAAIAQTLDISPRTVHRRIAEAMEQLDAHSRFELGVAWARRTDGD